FNARFGDPEALNVLSLLQTDFVDLCEAMLCGKLSAKQVKFSHQASVCKYAVPEGYPDSPVKNFEIRIALDKAGMGELPPLYFAGVDLRAGKFYGTGARTAAAVGIAETLDEAEKIAETEISLLQGPLFHRQDIGTAALIQKRILMMNTLRGLHGVLV